VSLAQYLVMVLEGSNSGETTGSLNGVTTGDVCCVLHAWTLCMQLSGKHSDDSHHSMIGTDLPSTISVTPCSCYWCHSHALQALSEELRLLVVRQRLADELSELTGGYVTLLQVGRQKVQVPSRTISAWCHRRPVSSRLLHPGSFTGWHTGQV
jgi:hypothetical protein